MRSSKPTFRFRKVIQSNEHTNQDITLLNHELLELTYMKNKKYNIYEVAHEMANKKYNWEILL